MQITEQNKQEAEKVEGSTIVNGTPQWLTDPTKAIVTFGEANLDPIDNSKYHQHNGFADCRRA